MELIMPAAPDWVRSAQKDAEGRMPQDMAAEEESATYQWNPPVGSFPEIAWRGVFKDYREAMQGSTSASDVAHYITVWSATAAGLARRVWMFLGGRIYPNIYVTYYGPTGDHKTTAQRRLVDYALLADRDDVPILRTTGSAEGLADAFSAAAQTGVVLFYWEEFAETLARARWSGATLFGFLTEAFDCPPVFDRAYRKNPIHIANPTPSVLTA